ncbi:M14 family zinc carboxypeptidase [Nocardioides dokdonensis]|uniref:M14 family zinc carboxypeptidase n=1 Tax=Nocardioides dokdonensis TaxID=450734 RepID=UPI0012FA0918|nr:M14 family zinc carboxypeptidase [Nocardioides dokdonensis]
MRTSRALVGPLGLALAATAALAGTGLPAAAEPSSPARADETPGRGPGTVNRVEEPTTAAVVKRAAETAVAGDPIDMPTSYPYQPALRLYRDNPDDAADTADLMGHPEIAPKLMELMGKSDRVSAQVVGQSTEGRDLYLVTVTAPEREQDTAQQTAWRDKIKNDPTAAAADSTLLTQYKTPVWMSNNIHGNEWEGTDAAMQYIEYLATAPMSEVGSILRNNRLYFSPSLNPDGRTNATRATAVGLDPNRDLITNQTPETRSFIRTAQAVQAIYAADFHGYTRVLQIEPAGPPHGSNYEFDLILPHNYALALKVEQDVVDAAIPGNTYRNVGTGEIVSEVTDEATAHIKIPYRDTPSGWDDFPPIFTAQYAAFYGAATTTVELPLTRGASGGRQTPERAEVNTAVAYQTILSMVDYLNDPVAAREMVENQIETFRRGVDGEAKTSVTTENIASVPGPSQWKALWDVVDDQEPVTMPRAYVIPVGKGQRSARDATSLVEQLLMHEIEVATLDAATTVGGTTYPAGSYVVDMHQPLRGLANSLLDLGDDISSKVPSMYDVSAWSYSYLWGADVDKVGLVTGAPLGATTPVSAPTDATSVPSRPGLTTFDVAGVVDFQALNALLEDSVPVSMLADGSVVIGADDFAAAAAVAREHGIVLEPASEADLDALDDEETTALSDLTIGYVGTQDDRLSLTELGFDDLVQLSSSSLESDPTLMDDVDVLWVASTFSPGADSVARAAVQSFVDEGGALLGRTNRGFEAAVSFGLMSGTVVSGNGNGNGIVAVDTPEGSVLAPYAQDHAFIYPAYSFTDLGEDVSVEQTYDAENPYLAGHWRATNATNGPDFAAGKASVVSSVDAETGARSMVFGTSVFFRTHPKGGLSQAARALMWAAPAGEAVVAPEGETRGTSTTTLEAQAKNKRKAKVTVTVEVDGEPGTGTVLVKDKGTRVEVLEIADGDDGTVKVTLRLGTGRHKLKAVRKGDDVATRSASAPVVLRLG